MTPRLLALVLLASVAASAQAPPPSSAQHVVVHPPPAEAPKPPRPVPLVRCAGTSGLTFDHFGMAETPHRRLVQGEEVAVSVRVPPTLNGVTRLQTGDGSAAALSGDYPYFVGAGQTTPGPGLTVQKASDGTLNSRATAGQLVAYINGRLNDLRQTVISSAGDVSVSATEIDLSRFDGRRYVTTDDLMALANEVYETRALRVWERASARLDCETVQLTIPRIAAGSTEIEIAHLPAGKTAFVPTGTIRLEAQPKFGGAVTFGLMRTDAPERTFSIVPEVFQTAAGSDTTRTVVAADSVGARWRPVLGVTPFALGWSPERGIQRFARPIRSREGSVVSLNPYLGVDVEAPLDNLYVGVTLGLFYDSVYMMGGRHLARTSKLPSGLDVGDAFTGAAAPTVRETNTTWYWGIGADAGPVISALGNVFKNVIK